MDDDFPIAGGTYEQLETQPTRTNLHAFQNAEQAIDLTFLNTKSNKIKSEFNKIKFE